MESQQPSASSSSTSPQSIYAMMSEASAPPPPSGVPATAAAAAPWHPPPHPYYPHHCGMAYPGYDAPPPPYYPHFGYGHYPSPVDAPSSSSGYPSQPQQAMQQNPNMPTPPMQIMTAMMPTTTAAPLRDIIVWYQLADGKGETFHDSSPDGLSIAPHSIMFQLRDAIYAKNKPVLPHVSPAFLKVFASLEDLRQNEELQVDRTISELTTTTKDTPLYIVVSPFKKPKYTEEYEFEEIPLTFPHIIFKMPSAGDVVTVLRSEGNTNVDVPLYVRQHMVVKLQEIEAEFENNTGLLQLRAVGAPGCGKTCFFWMWAMMKMQQGKRLLFIQYRSLIPSIWILEDKKMKKMISLLEKENLLKVVTQVMDQQTIKFDFAILDGVLYECDDLVTALICRTGNAKYHEIFKSVFVTSLPYRKPHGYEAVNGGLFNETWNMSLDSWTESDYDQVAKSQFLVKSGYARQLLLNDWMFLKTNNNEPPPPDDEKVKQAIQLKYDFAGGSARYMFEFDFLTLDMTLNDMMKEMTIDQWKEFATNAVPSKAASSVNSLMQRFTKGRYTYCIPVSKYVLRRAYSVCGDWLAESVTAAADSTQNPSLLGWAFEMAENK